jgi:hypothetical protein
MLDPEDMCQNTEEFTGEVGTVVAQDNLLGLGMVVDRRLPPSSRTHESRVWQGLSRQEVGVVWILRGATGR